MVWCAVSKIPTENDMQYTCNSHPTKDVNISKAPKVNYIENILC